MVFELSCPCWASWLFSWRQLQANCSYHTSQSESAKTSLSSRSTCCRELREKQERGGVEGDHLGEGDGNDDLQSCKAE